MMLPVSLSRLPGRLHFCRDDGLGEEEMAILRRIMFRAEPRASWEVEPKPLTRRQWLWRIRAQRRARMSRKALR